MIQTEILKQRFPQFADERLRDEIAQNAKIHTFDAGDIVIDVGVEIPFIPLIISGNMRVVRRDENDNEILLYYLSEGQTCATSLTCCMSHTASEVEAIAEDDLKLLGIPSKLVDEWFEKYPEWKAFVMRSYKFRFDELLETINSIAFQHLDQRLVKYLKQKAELHETQNIRTSHQEIATDLNSSREVISRMLKQLERNGKIKLARNLVQIIDL